MDVDALAQEIRRVDGRHDLGAGQLAEALMPFLSSALPVPTQIKARETDEAAFLVAAKKLRALRIETVGGRKERAARTVGSIIDREGDLKGDTEFVAWVIKKALKYYEDAKQIVE